MPIICEEATANQNFTANLFLCSAVQFCNFGYHCLPLIIVVILEICRVAVQAGRAQSPSGLVTIEIETLPIRSLIVEGLMCVH